MMIAFDVLDLEMRSLNQILDLGSDMMVSKRWSETVTIWSTWIPSVSSAQEGVVML